VPAYLLNSTILGVSAALVRTLCKHCRKSRLRTGARRGGPGATSRGGVRRALEGEAPGARLPAGGLPRMPQHRLHGPRRLYEICCFPPSEAAGQRRADVAKIRDQAYKEA